MTTTTIALLISILCPDLEEVKPEYIVQGVRVDCMEYYTNDIINNPNKYKKVLENVKTQ